MPRNPIPASRLAAFVVACLVVVAESGCTSALTTAYLREGLWGESDHAPAQASDDGAHSRAAAAAKADTESEAAPDRERREAALEEAMERLSRLGSVDSAVEAALVATLQRTQPEDWPVVVDEFAISLSSARPATGPAGASPPAVGPGPEPTSASHDEPDIPADPPAEAKPVRHATAPPTGPAVSEPSAAVSAPAPPLAVRTACFASAVRGWGDLDRYAADRFRPGQEVIVYVELDNLSASESPAGHTTCIDAALRLVDDADRPVHAWRFDPIAETGTNRRRDYFARYVVRIPEAAPPGGCRVEMAITDTLAGSTAEAALPLEIAAAE